MLIKTFGGAVYGVNAAIITIEVNIIQGASFYLVGLPDNAVKESQFRIESTFKSNNFRMPGRRVIVNMAPADLKKEGSAYDLPLAIGILAASGQILCPDLDKYLIMGNCRSTVGQTHQGSIAYRDRSPEERLPGFHPSRS